MIINIFLTAIIISIISIGFCLMIDTLKEINYRNSKAYLKAINKVKPKFKK
jgi:hypothetical protein